MNYSKNWISKAGGNVISPRVCGIPHVRENAKFEMRKLEIGEEGPTTLLTRYAEELGPLRPTLAHSG